MALDRRLPGVYVDIEDRSLATEQGETGRSGYVVILSDKGPHNKMVELNSRQDLYDLFGEPDFTKYGHAHYLADMHLRRSSKLYVCRPAMMEPFAGAVSDDCMTIANVYLKVNMAPGAGVTTIPGSFAFIENSNVVVADATSLAQFSIGEWIYPNTESKSSARQIISIDTTDGELILDSIYTGATVTGDVDKYKKFELSSITKMHSEDDCDILKTDVLWYFYAIGAGSPYNQYFIKGVRNIQFERIYTDSDGNPLFPYAFMDIAIYRKNEDGTTTMLEGPWTVSLINRTPTGSIIRDIYTGLEIYLPTVINKRSRLVRCKEGLGVGSLSTVGSGISYPYAPDVQARLMVQAMFSEGTILGLDATGNGGAFLQNGSCGNLFDSAGLLNMTNQYRVLVAQAYDGSLKSTDGSVELIVQEVYPWYVFDYVLCGGYDNMINASAKSLVDTRGDCLLLTDTGQHSLSADEDLEARRIRMDWNTWNAAIYVQYRKISDTHTGKEFWVTPVYHAIARHLHVDDLYWIAEPVAGIEKGAIEDAIDLAYKPNLTKMGDLIDQEMNPVIVEPDGVYILTQYTTWKRLSVMKRQHVVKFVHYIKKRIPSLLKDVLQRKATRYWINECQERVNGFMNPFLDHGDSDRYAAITSFYAVVVFDDVRSEIKVGLTIRPIRAIERIMVNILVV